MNFILGIFGLAIFVGVIYTVQNVLDAANRTFNRNILFRRSYTGAMEQIRNATTVMTTLSPRDAMDAVRDGIGVRETESLLRAGITVNAISDAHLRIVIGNVLSENYVCQSSATRRENVTYAQLEVVRWIELNGVPARSKELRQLKDDFVAALRRADPGARLVPAGARSYRDAQPLGSPRVCVEESCELADQATQKLRCPQCDQFTQFRTG